MGKHGQHRQLVTASAPVAGWVRVLLSVLFAVLAGWWFFGRPPVWELVFPPDERARVAPAIRGPAVPDLTGQPKAPPPTTTPRPPARPVGAGATPAMLRPNSAGHAALYLATAGDATPQAATSTGMLSDPPPVAPPVARPALPADNSVAPDQTNPPLAIVAAARRQVGVTSGYDPAYVKLTFPGGDVPRESGVCSDVIIRALRDALDIDLQAAVNGDMKRHFAAYPRNWGLKRPDPNIDHRRVPNLETLLMRMGARLSDDVPDLPGDLVTVRLPGNLPHIMIVSDHLGANGRPLVIHNVGRGAKEEAVRDHWPVTARFRLNADVRAKLTALSRQ